MYVFIIVYIINVIKCNIYIAMEMRGGNGSPII